jgi:predicted amidohydrolase
VASTSGRSPPKPPRRCLTSAGSVGSQSTVGLLICNDRRWAESYRVLALQGAELVCLGYNTPVKTPHLPETDPLADFQSHLSMQAGAYQNSLWVVGAAKAGIEEGVDQIGGSAVFAPSGEIVARARTKDDELVVAEIYLDMSARYRKDIFSFSQHRRPEHYGLIFEPVDVRP